MEVVVSLAFDGFVRALHTGISGCAPVPVHLSDGAFQPGRSSNLGWADLRHPPLTYSPSNTGLVDRRCGIGRRPGRLMRRCPFPNHYPTGLPEETAALPPAQRKRRPRPASWGLLSTRSTATTLLLALALSVGRGAHADGGALPAFVGLPKWSPQPLCARAMRSSGGSPPVVGRSTMHGQEGGNGRKAGANNWGGFVIPPVVVPPPIPPAAGIPGPPAAPPMPSPPSFTPVARAFGAGGAVMDM